MRGDAKIKILEILASTTINTVELLSIFTAPYGSSINMNRRHRGRVRAKIEKLIYGLLEELKSKRALRNLIYKLQKDGLIERKGKNIRATKPGKKWMASFMETPRRKKYETAGEDEFKIIIFDIPEKERKARDILRFTLNNLGFTRLQKSVLVGKVKVPEELIEDLRRWKIIKFVEIFAITKRGSLRQIN